MQAAPAVEPVTPRVADTYSLFYAFTLIWLVPGVALIGQLPFRTYTLAYVSLVTVPFILGFAVTLLSDSDEPMKTRLLRIAVLTPLVLLTGVAVLFTSSLLLVPINDYLGPEHRDITTPAAVVLLAALASPLVVAIWRRLRARVRVIAAVQVLAMLIALGFVVTLAVLSFRDDRLVATMVRKDLVIYIVGALVWYLPAFGISAGVWRRLGLV